MAAMDGSYKWKNIYTDSVTTNDVEVVVRLMCRVGNCVSFEQLCLNLYITASIYRIFNTFNSVKGYF